MRLVQSRTDSFVREPHAKPTDVFATERTLSPLGTHHRPDESPAEALARIAYTRLVGHEPTAEHTRALAQALRVTLGCIAGIVLARTLRSLGRGAASGVALWLVLDELLFPLVGLADRPTAYHPTYHARLLAERVSYGVTSALTNRALEVVS